MKALANQAEILRLIKDDGWEIGFSDTSSGGGRYWMQKGGLCKGGDSRNVHTSTVHAMFKAGLLKDNKKANDPFWLRRYQLAKP